MQIGGKAYHDACVLCTTCGKNLAHEAFSVHPTTGAIFCAEHARQGQQAPPAAGTAASGAAATAPLVAAGARCGGCHQAVNPAASPEPLISTGSGGYYHQRCLRCAQCASPLHASDKVYSEGGVFFCERDYQARFAKRCHTCAQAITAGSFVSIDTGDASVAQGTFHFHPTAQCFKCVKCATSLQGQGFYLSPNKDGLVCEKC
jgi:hypothetical protein